MATPYNTHQPQWSQTAKTLWPKHTAWCLYRHLITVHTTTPGTVVQWFIGVRPAPPWALDAIAIIARQRAALLLGLAPAVEDEAEARHKTYRQPKPRKAGFMLVCERDGPGSLPRDGRKRKAT